MSLFHFFKKDQCNTAQFAKNRLQASVRKPGTDVVSNIKTAILEAVAQHPGVQENKVTFSSDKKQSALYITIPIQES
jgi:septum formation topological specificity factor MinE